MSEKIEYSMVPIKMADLASFIAAKKNMAVSDAICYLYNSEFVAKLYDEKSKWWYLDNETLYELMEQERRNNSVDFSAQKVQFVIFCIAMQGNTVCLVWRYLSCSRRREFLRFCGIILKCCILRGMLIFWRK